LCPASKGDGIEFKTKTTGIFLILEPVLQENELFNSNFLRDFVDNQISQGNRNFALQLESIDYIYSDTINVILSLNRKILDVSGRLSLLSPNPEVMQSLQRAGIHNILKIYSSELELKKSSEDIIMQTSSYRLSDIQKYAQGQQPAAKDEFEDMRSSFSSSIPDVPQDSQQQQYRAAPPPPPPPPPPSQQQQSGYQGYNQTPTGSYPQQGSGIYQQPPTQQFQNTPTGSYPSYPQTGQYPQPPASQTGSWPTNQQGYGQMPPHSQTGSQVSNQQVDHLFSDKPRKKSAVPVVLFMLFGFLIVAGALSAWWFLYGPGKGQLSTVLPFLPTQQSSAPAVAATDTAAVADSLAQLADTTDTADEGLDETASDKVAQSKPAQKAPSRPKPAPKPAPKPTRSYTPPKPVNKVTIYSSPSGAMLYIDNRAVGKTPYTIENPFFGGIAIRLSHPGYEDRSEIVEFTGGSIERSFSLEPEPVASSPSYQPEPEPEPEPEPQPSYSAEPSRQAPQQSAPAPQRQTSAPSTPPPPPPASEPSGEHATIFIASIPPVADVYLNGQLIGKTNVSELKVRSGTHTLKFSKNGKELSKTMTFQPGKNPPQVVRFP